ncbi:MAG: ABC transporter permease [Candidatus Lokiarchaeota archaeon]|nr:ABC transporter permease [Candidatus Lokiarchaeota archaeon]
MKQEEVYEEEFELKQEKNVISAVFSWFISNIKFLLVPGSRVEELTQREIEYERVRSKRKFIRRFKSFLTITGIVLIFVIASFAVLAPWISPGTFVEANGIYFNQWGPPSEINPLGQTSFGRDVLTRLIWGARSSLTIALPAISLSVIFGVMIGIISAYYGGWVDSIIMRIMDIFLAFPGLILAMVFIAIWGQEIQFIMLAWGILGIPYYSRLIRGNVLQARKLPYIEAARVSGAGSWRIMFKHIMPNVIQPIIISFTFDIGGIILSLAGLAFLGFSDPRMIEWGNDIADARGHLYDAPWASLWPGFIILLTVLGFMLVGDGLRDALDPKLKNL